jgi:hypothetical protein
MDLSTQATMLTQKNKEEDSISGQMVINILESGKKTLLMVKEYISGQMAESTMDNG